MPVVDKNQLKLWFKNLAKPVQEQFWNWMDSFYHKSEAIPKSAVENLTSDLAKKADLVGGVVPASQLPFSVNTSEVIAIGAISATEDTVTLSVHSSGANVVRIDGVLLERTFPNTFNFTPVSTGSKFLILYAINDSGIFRLAEGVEDLEAVEPELPVGALFVRRILVNSAGTDVELPSLTGFKEKIEDGWKVFTFIEALTPKLLPFSTDKKTSFLIQKIGDFTGDLHLGGIKLNETGLDYWWGGKEFTIKNNTSNNLILLAASNYTGSGIKFNIAENVTVGAGKSIKVKASLDGSILEVLNQSVDIDISGKQDRLQTVSGNVGVGKTDASATEKLDVSGRIKSNGLVLNETSSAILPKEIKFKDGKFKAALSDGVEKAVLLEGDLNIDFDSFSRLLQNENFGWQKPQWGSTTYQNLHIPTNIVQQGHTNEGASTGSYKSFGITYKSNGATLGFMRGASSFFVRLGNSSFSRRFTIDTTVSTQRIYIGVSDNYRQSAPTNIQLNLISSFIGICMESGNSNLLLMHNDSSGNAVVVDTGFNNVNAYFYDLKISGYASSNNVLVILERISSTNGSKEKFEYLITSKLPAIYETRLSFALWCVDSLGVAEVKLTDYGGSCTWRHRYLQ